MMRGDFALARGVVRALTIVPTVAVVLLTWLVLDWWAGAHRQLIETAPDVRVMDDVSLTLVANKPVVIGRNELGQASMRQSPAAGPAAAAEHVEFVLRVPDPSSPDLDRIEIRNVAAARRLWLEFADGFETFAERFEIPPSTEADTRFALGSATVTLRNVTRTGFDITTTGTADGGQNVAGPFHYRNASWPGALIQQMLQEPVAGAADHDVVAAHLGGSSTFEHQYPLQIALDTALDWQQLRLVYRGDRLFLAIGRDLDRLRYPIVMTRLKPGTDAVQTGAPPVNGFRAITWSVAASTPADPVARGLRTRLREALFGFPHDATRPPVLRRLIAGRTSYAVRIDDRSAHGEAGAVTRTVHLRPVRKAMLFRSFCPAGAEPGEGCPMPVGPLAPADRRAYAEGREPVRALQCGTQNRQGTAIEQCWGTTTSVATFGSSGMASPVRTGPLPIAPGPAGGLKEAAATKWLVLVLVLGWAFGCRPRSRSDLFFDGAAGDGIAGAVRSPAARTLVVLVSLLIALAPELLAAASRWTGSDLTLSPGTALTPLVLNWALAGLALVVFTPTASLSVALAWLAVTGLAAIGSLSLASLAVDGPNTHWASYFLKHRYLFLDVVPPTVVAVATISRSRFLAALHAALHRSGLGYTLLRIAPPMLLIVLFAFWMLTGSQTGVSGFQPIEAGKFVAIILIAAVLIGLVGYGQDAPVRIRWVERLLSMGAFLAFTVMLLYVPYLRSDYSPLLIVFILGASVGLIYVVLAAFGILYLKARSFTAWRRLPLAFRPKRRVNRAALAAALVVLVAAATTVWTALNWYPVSARMLLHVADTSDPEPTDSKADPHRVLAEHRIRAIITALGQGRHTPALRFITWYDLDPDIRAPVVRYRDLDYHVVRSRIAVAHWMCHAAGSSVVDPQSRWWWAWLSPVVWTIPRAVLGAPPGKVVPDDPCLPKPAPTTAPDNTHKTESETYRPADASLDRLAVPVAPIDIPVAESDFAPAYMLARYGTGLAVALFTAQSLLVLVGLYALARIHIGPAAGRLGLYGTQFVGVMLAGSLTLYLIQWTLSWANTLGLLPVMGQPMTWIAAANSHHLFMALPCLIVILLSLRLAGRIPQFPRQRVPPDRRVR